MGVDDLVERRFRLEAERRGARASKFCGQTGDDLLDNRKQPPMAASCLLLIISII
jgi:hypothetical protein